jgi:2-hydroxychromene-2-carboxylate isomerase
MAERTVEFFFDVGSPTSYLAWRQLPKIAAETGATIDWRPMLLGGVFKATGNASPVSVPAKGRWMSGDIASPAAVPAKGRWMNEDLQRWAARYGVTLRFNPHFPINTLTLMRGAAGMQMRSPDGFLRYLDVIERAMWETPKNLGDADVLVATLADAGFEPTAFAALVADPEVKAKLIANTEEAVARGVFGAPTFFVGEQMFFGQDRLDFVREALLGRS